MGVSHGSSDQCEDPTRRTSGDVSHATFPSPSGLAIYGIALAALAIAGLWTAFLVVACVGGLLTGLMYLLIVRSNRAREATI